jgi:hypothetical protein
MSDEKPTREELLGSVDDIIKKMLDKDTTSTDVAVLKAFYYTTKEVVTSALAMGAPAIPLLIGLLFAAHAAVQSLKHVKNANWPDDLGPNEWIDHVLDVIRKKVVMSHGGEEFSTTTRKQVEAELAHAEKEKDCDGDCANCEYGEAADKLDDMIARMMNVVPKNETFH